MKNGLSEDYLLVERLLTPSTCCCFTGQASKTGFQLHIFNKLIYIKEQLVSKGEKRESNRSRVKMRKNWKCTKLKTRR